MAEERFSFAGRSFRMIGLRTIENDFTSMNLIRGARLDAVEVGDDEPPEDFAARLYERAIADEQVFSLLGCMLIPEELNDLSWTKLVMAQTADHLRTVNDIDEKRQIQRAVVSMIAGFFRSGLASLRTSRRSSSRPEVEAQPSSETGAASTTATGS